MIILSVGMPRAGSGWYYNLTNDLMLAAGSQDAREIRRRYRLQRILTEVNCNIGALTPRRLLAVLLPSWMGNTFVVKAHAGPTPFARRLLRSGQMRAAYIYRDPRDALLSAMENGRRAVEKGRSNAFSYLVDFETGMAFMQEYVYISEAWLRTGEALHTRYEDLLGNYEPDARRLVDFLGVDGADPGIQAVLDRYRPEQGSAEQKGIHFSTGKTGRFRQKFSEEQQEALRRAFEPYLERLGYAV